MTTASLTAIPQSEFKRLPWKNGGGISLDITGAHRPGAEAGDWSGTIWRLGRTAITTPAPFSDLTGYERTQLVIEGAGLVLDSQNGEIDLRVPLRPVRYDGGLPLVSRLENGPVEVINLMAERAACDIDLTVPQAGSSVTAAAGIHIIYAPRGSVAGRAGGESFVVPAGDALRIDVAATAELQIESGLAVLASVRPK
jgi:environmental stress-induced protein Ves